MPVARCVFLHKYIKNIGFFISKNSFKIAGFFSSQSLCMSLSQSLYDKNTGINLYRCSALHLAMFDNYSHKSGRGCVGKFKKKSKIASD